MGKLLDFAIEEKIFKRLCVWAMQPGTLQVYFRSIMEKIYENNFKFIVMNAEYFFAIFIRGVTLHL